ncbi:MAG: DNA mismatch repair endonuclease MutL [Alphaproteobacteria bacterium]|nr:DNA mismatch repair endonuclease MutL [Alphaproteobacteria bacterium]
MIRVLEDVVVDQIAAGEVVERPASVLKELVENALDAGATRLEIRLKDGGASLVRVTDDGSGMSADDALLCVERHATSKLRTADELVGIATFGFRGEALASIASVSRFELRTRRADDDLGTTVRIEGGRMEHVGPSAGAAGTDIAVRALFHNVPARRRFLRTPQTELAHCMEAVHRQIVLRPEIDVTVWHDGREILRAPASDDPARRVRDVVGDDVDPLVPVWLEAGGLEVSGLVAPPDVHRASMAGGVYTFVHGRYVRDTLVRRGVREAFSGRVPRGRYPVVVLDVRGPRGFVDVNVHPAKTEVRFQRPNEVLQVVTDAVQAALSGPAPRRQVTRGVLPRAPDEQLDLLARPAPPVVAEPVPAPTPPAGRTAVGAATPRPVPSPRPAPLPAAPRPAASAPPPASAAPPPAPPTRPSTPTGTPRLDVHDVVGTVAVATRDDALVLVDLAALQRQVTAARLRRGGVGQPLLAPSRVSLGRADAEAVLAAAEMLSALGVEVMAFAPGELAVTALPEALPPTDPAALLAAVAGVAGQGTEVLIDAMAASAGVPSTRYDARTLLAAWEELPQDARGGGVATLDAAALAAVLRSHGG